MQIVKVLGRVGKVVVAVLFCTVIVGLCFRCDETLSRKAHIFDDVQKMVRGWRVEVSVKEGEVSVVSKGASVEKPRWFLKSVHDGAVVESCKSVADIEIIPDANQDILLRLKGVSFKDHNGKRLQFWVDFISVVVNGEEMLQNPTSVSIKSALELSVKANRDKPIRIRIQTRRHVYRSEELSAMVFSRFAENDRDDVAHALTATEKGCLGYLNYLLKPSLLELSLSLILSILLIKLLKEQFLQRLFVLIFIVLLVAPWVRQSDETISESENRNLAKMPSIRNENEWLNLNYARQFENWFNDHYGFRAILIRAHAFLQEYINRVVRQGGISLDMNTGWMFIRWQTQDMKDSIMNSLESSFAVFKNWLDELGIELYVVLVPNKARVYAEPAQKVGLCFKDNKVLSQVRFQLSSQFPNHFVYPLEELLETSKQEYVFYKTSHHWTESGALVAWRILCQKMRENGMDIDLSCLEDSQFNISSSVTVREELALSPDIGHNLRRMGYTLDNYPKGVLSSVYKNYESNAKNFIVEKNVMRNGRLCGFEYENQKANQQRVFVIGTSHTCLMQPFMGHTFSSVKFIRLNSCQFKNREEEFKVYKNYKKDILKFKPDVLVLCITEENLERIPSLMKGD